MEDAWRELPLFNLNSYEDVMAVLEEVKKELILTGKRLRRAVIDFGDSLGDRLWTRLKKFGHSVEDAFRIETIEDYNQAVSVYGAELADTMYGLSVRFAGLKAAVLQAAAPIAQALVPVIRLAMDALTGLFQAIGYLIRALFGGGEAAQSYTAGLQGAASAGNALKRSLAGFDQLNRLGKQSSGSSGGFLGFPEIEPLSEGWKDFADGILKLLEPLRKIDLTPLSKALERLQKALEPITRALFEALEWAWYNIFVPMAEWAAEELLPAFLDALTAALEALARVIEELKPAFVWLWENYLKPLAYWKAEETIRYLQNLTQELNGNGNMLLQNQTIVDKFTQSGRTLIATLAELAGGYLNTTVSGVLLEESVDNLIAKFIWAQTPFGNMDSAMGLLGSSILGVSDNFGLLTMASDDAWKSLEQVWGNAWSYLKEKTMDPTYQGFKATANSMIGVVNGILRGVTGGVNGITGALNKLSFTVPGWVPVFGGKSLSFQLPKVETPQIPLLAKGAVLPANKPFLAVVGDQTHGTNVEAPLSTIQEAVALTMDDYSSANMAGHAATVEILRELLTAVLGIQIGDETIAAAVSRYDRKMAMVRGGVV